LADDDDGAPDTSAAKIPRFKTDAGRAVLGGGGITPDVRVTPQKVSENELAFERALGKHIPQFRDALTDYALSIKASRSVTSPNFVVTPAMREELLKRMQARGCHDRPGNVRCRGAADRSRSRLRDRALLVRGERAVRARLRSDATMAAALQLMSTVSTPREAIDRAGRQATAPPAS
jgi:hypothetical protein